MPRKSVHSTTIVQAVRRYFGLEQQELAAYLGIGRAGPGAAAPAPVPPPSWPTSMPSR